MKRFITQRLIPGSLTLLAVLTVGHWMPYWIAAWQYVASLALGLL